MRAKNTICPEIKCRVSPISMAFDDWYFLFMVIFTSKAEVSNAGEIDR